MLQGMLPNHWLPVVPWGTISLGLLCMSGCGDSHIRPVKGQVVYQGTPVTGGEVTFTPMNPVGESGRPATAVVGPEGTFVLSTNDRFDGAQVGKHSVQYVAPEQEGQAEEGVEAEDSASEGSAAERALHAKKIRDRQAQARKRPVQRQEIIVEVTADGDNEFTIELSPAKP